MQCHKCSVEVVEKDNIWHCGSCGWTVKYCRYCETRVTATKLPLGKPGAEVQCQDCAAIKKIVQEQHQEIVKDLTALFLPMIQDLVNLEK